MTRVNFFSVLLIISAIVFLPANLSSRVTIGSTDTPQEFSVLELFSNETMGLRLPQLSEYQRDNHLTPMLRLSEIDTLTGVSPAMGLQIFNTCIGCVETWNGVRWISHCIGEIPFVLPPHFDEGCHTDHRFVVCFAGLRRLSVNIRRLADVTNSGNHAGNAESFTAAGVSFSMMPVTGGIFYMGAQNTDANSPNHDPIAVNPVTLVGVNSFFIGQTEVTRELWRAVLGASGTFGEHTLEAVQLPAAPTRPDSNPDTDGLIAMNNVSWFDAVVFMNRLSVITGRTPFYTIGGATILNSFPASGVVATPNPAGDGFRFPTEAEWEYAARGGQMNEYTRSLGASGTHFRFSGENENVSLVAWHSANSGGQTNPVRSLASNQLGIFDMSGNVWEWVWDWQVIRPSCCAVNPVGPSVGSLRVIRGGSWIDSSVASRVSTRGNFPPTGEQRHTQLGFRLATNVQ